MAGVLKITTLLIAFLYIIEGVSAKSQNETLTCIRKKCSDSMVNCFENSYKNLSSFTEINRVKEAMQRCWKDDGLMRASGTQVYKDKMAKYAENNKNNPVGKAIATCMKNDKEDAMMKMGAKLSQCVFGDLKKTCEKR